jgi:hypothetical protein
MRACLVAPTKIIAGAGGSWVGGRAGGPLGAAWVVGRVAREGVGLGDEVGGLRCWDACRPQPLHGRALPPALPPLPGRRPALRGVAGRVSHPVKPGQTRAAAGLGMSLGIDPLEAPGATGSYDSDFASKAETVRPLNP